MGIVTKASAAAKFETNDRPTQQDFADLIDSSVFIPSAGAVGVIEIESTASSTNRNVGAFGVVMLAAGTTASAQGHLGGGVAGIQVFTAITTASAQGHLALSVGTTDATQIPTNADIQAQAVVAFDDTGAVNAYVITPVPAITAYAKYQTWIVDIANANTGAATMNINALGTRNIFDYRTGAALIGGEMLAGIHTFIDDGTQLILMDPATGVLQIDDVQDGAVATGTTVLPVDDSIPQNTEGDEYMTLAFTPRSASSKLRIDITWIGSHSTTGAFIGAALFRDSAADALAAAGVQIQTATHMTIISFSHKMASPGASSTTFKVRAGGQNAGTTTFNGFSAGRIYGGVIASSITITEYI